MKPWDVFRFWRQVEMLEELSCWNWKGAIFQNGYAQFSHNGKTVKASRFVYAAVRGTIPDGMFVCHSCDNKKCVNPAHLFLGTAKDNVHDMMQKKRDRCVSGSEHYTKTRPWLVQRGDNHYTRRRPDLVMRGDTHPWHKRPELIRYGEDNGFSKLTSEQVIAIRQRLLLKESQDKIAKDFGVSQTCISGIATGRHWKHVQLPDVINTSPEADPA
jgi:hypothetical protein